jgi:glycosyltransferase involved in cell wall biosynthesis
MAGAPNGGAELFYERMTMALARDGHDVLAAIRPAAARIERLLAAGLPPATFRFGGPLDVFTRPRLRTALKTFRPDVAIAWMSRAAIHLPRGEWTNIGRLGGYYDLKYFHNCDFLVGNTHGIVRYIGKTGFPPARTAHLPNFVDDFGGVEAADRAALGVPEDAPLLLGLGRLHAVKGFDTLIRAAASLPDVYCVIAGEGPERAALERLIGDLHVADRVKLLGWRHDTGALLKAADVFVASSRHEPLGNMVLEAFSAQTPVLAARSEGPSEIIRDGEDGVLVPIDDAPAMADAARAMLARVPLRVKLALNARRRFAEEFAEPVVLAAWRDFLARARR